MKIPRCTEQITVAGTTRYCLLDAGHERPQEYFGPGHLKREGKPHEFAPLCDHCHQVVPTTPGDERNVRIAA